MDNTRVFKMSFASVYPHYIQKAEKKGRTKEEVDAIICWLTGYDQKSLQRQIDEKASFETFFAQAPQINTDASKITGVICGYRVEEIEDKLMQKIRYLDKLIDELAKGKAMEKILRLESGNKSNDARPSPFSQTFFHGTKADLKMGDLITNGFNSNYGKKNKAGYIYLSATLDAAIWGAELALDEGPERIYLVEPTGPIEDDPNLTDKKFPGNPTMSYRSGHPFKVVGEVTIWQGHSPEQVKAMKDGLEKLKEQGIEAIG